MKGSLPGPPFKTREDFDAWINVGGDWWMSDEDVQSVIDLMSGFDWTRESIEKLHNSVYTNGDWPTQARLKKEDSDIWGVE